MPRFCSQCGTQVPDNNAFCSNCGAPVAQPAQQPQAVQLAKPDQQAEPIQQVIPQNDQNMQQGAPQQFAQNSAPQQNAGQQFVQNPMPQQNGGQQFAPNGMQQQYAQPKQPGALALKLKSMPKKKLMIGAGALAAVIVAIVLIIVLGKGSYKDPLDLYKKVLEKGDTKAYSKSYFDVDNIFSSSYDESNDRERALEMRADFIDRYGADAKVSYDVLSCTPSSQKELVQYNKAMQLLGGNKYKIKKCYKLKVIFTYRGSLGADTDTKTFEVAQTKDGWKFLDTTPRYIYY